MSTVDAQREHLHSYYENSYDYYTPDGTVWIGVGVNTTWENDETHVSSHGLRVMRVDTGEALHTNGDSDWNDPPFRYDDEDAALEWAANQGYCAMDFLRPKYESDLDRVKARLASVPKLDALRLAVRAAAVYEAQEQSEPAMDQLSNAVQTYTNTRWKRRMFEQEIVAIEAKLAKCVDPQVRAVTNLLFPS